MQNRRSWEGGSPSELEDVWRRKVAVRSFIEASWSIYAEQIILPSNRAAAAASSLQTVYDLAAKRRVGLRFNCKNLTSKCASLRFICNRQEVSARLSGRPLGKRLRARLSVWCDKKSGVPWNFPFLGLGPAIDVMGALQKPRMLCRRPASTGSKGVGAKGASLDSSHVVENRRHDLI